MFGRPQLDTIKSSLKRALCEPKEACGDDLPQAMQDLLDKLRETEKKN